MHIVDMVYYWARTMPLRPAVIEPEGVISYGELAHASETASKHFALNIADRSKPVAVSITSGSKFLVAVLGLLRAGFSVVLASKGVLQHLKSAGVTTLVYNHDGGTLDQGANILFNDAWVKFDANAGAQSRPIPQPRTTGGSIVCFTSGTTGRPKIVVCPESSWQERVLLPLNSVFSSYERILIVPGIANSWGFSRAYEALHQGRTICLAPFGPTMLRMTNTHDIDTILASPQQALQLAEIQEKITRYPLASLKALHIGASKISQDGINRIAKYLCRNVVIIYGSTEAGVVSVAPYDMIARTKNAVGFIVPGVDVEIVDAADRVLPVGKEGFVRVRSPVLRRNLAVVESAGGDSASTWFYAGDVGWLTEDGVLCIAGRTGDVLNRGGNKLSSTDFENFLLSCPGIKDAGVCTLMTQSGFEEAWVAVVVEPSMDMGAFRRTIESDAQFGANIDKIFVVEAIPRGALGKIQRDELRKMLQDIGADGASTNAASELTSDAQLSD